MPTLVESERPNQASSESDESRAFLDACERVDMGDAEPPGDVDEEAMEEATAAPEDRQPVGSGEYLVEQGECIPSIAFEHGHFWETIWNDPANVDVKKARQDPYVLLPGDRVHIPPLRMRQEDAATDQLHTYILRGVPEKLHVRLLGADGEPLAEAAYDVMIDDVWQSSDVTNDQGDALVSIRPNARAGKIVIHDSGEEIPLQLGGLDPITEVSGVQGRLQNLGYEVDTTDGEWTPATADAIAEFQQEEGLTVTGELDDETLAKLSKAYGG